jgi:hypothetical protein
LTAIALAGKNADMKKALALAAVLFAGGRAAAWPAGFDVLPGSRSPDGTLAVLAPDAAHAKDGARQNQLVEIGTGKLLATIAADTVFEHQNHVDAAPRWSADGALLVWYADGKWGSYVFVLLRLDHGRVVAQIDVRGRAVAGALAAVRAAHPKGYAAAKEAGRGEGRWFRDGFAVDVRPATDETTLPLPIAITLTSNPKALDDYPAAAWIEGKMTGVVGVDGKVTLGRLELTRGGR